MKKLNYLLLLTAFCLAFTSCHHSYSTRSGNVGYVKSSGNVVKKDMVFPEFNAINVSTVANVFITDMDENRVSIEVDEAFWKYIDISVSHHTLKIKNVNGGYSSDGKGVVNIYVSGKNIRNIKMSGASHVTIKDKWIAPNLDIDMSGATELNGVVESDNISIDVSGASKLSLKGSAKNIIIDASGASDVDMFDLVAQYVGCEVSGASSIKFNAENDIMLDVSGASNVVYKGAGKVSHLKSSGASSVTKE